MIMIPMKCNPQLIIVVTLSHLKNDIPFVEKIVYYDLTPNKNIIIE